MLRFHYGRGAQEGIFAEAKQQAGLDLIPTRRLVVHRMDTLVAMMTHNLGRQVQMLATIRAPAIPEPNVLRHGPFRAWLRYAIVSSNPKVKKNLFHVLEALKQAA